MLSTHLQDVPTISMARTVLKDVTVKMIYLATQLMGHANVKTAQTSAKMYLQNRIIVAGNYLLKKLIFLVDC